MALRTITWLAATAATVVGLTVSAQASGPAGSGCIAIPRVRGMSVVHAYERLHRAGFEVSILEGFEVDSLGPQLALVQQLSPAAGSRLPRGSVVRLDVGCSCAAASPSVPARTLPRYTVPDFAGQSVSLVRRWIANKTLYLNEHVGPLRAGDAGSLYRNYTITKQYPRPGTTLSLGVRDVSGTSGGCPGARGTLR
jgi:beta-lactam-binding protein with PASTA domain